MIRFSAALVAVAIGVLVGGIATSKLLLVYIAIAVSAVALVVLAIGVLLKRQELFGDGQGLVPAGAGASPVPSAYAGESRDRVPVGVPAGPPPVPGTAAGFGVPFAGVPAAPAAVAGPPGTRAAAPGRSADPVPPWEATAARTPWTTPAPSSSAQPSSAPSSSAPSSPEPASSAPAASAPDWMPAANDQRSSSGFGGLGRRVPSAWQDPAPGAGQADSWAASGAPTAPAATPRAWTEPVREPVREPAQGTALPDAPGTGLEAGPPSWFGRRGTPSGAEAPVPASGDGWPWSSRAASPPSDPPPAAADAAAPGDTVSGDTVSGDTVSGDTVSGDTVSGNSANSDNTASADEDDDWPTRYSWLEDEADESGESGEPGQARDEDAAAETAETAVADAGRRTGTGKAAEPEPEPEAGAPAGTSPERYPASAEPPTVAAPVMTVAATARDAEAVGTGTGEGTAGEPAGAAGEAGPDDEAPAGLDLASAPAPDAQEPQGVQDASPGAEADGDAEAGAEAAGEPPAGQEAASGTDLVSVVRGVPRYHEPDCVLIRFMPDADVQRVTIPQAREEGCTPCAACQPPA